MRAFTANYTLLLLLSTLPQRVLKINNKNWCASESISSKQVSHLVHRSIKCGDPFCKAMWGVRRSPCTNPCSWIRKSSSISWWLSDMAVLNPKKLRKTKTAHRWSIRIASLIDDSVRSYLCLKLLYTNSSFTLHQSRIHREKGDSIEKAISMSMKVANAIARTFTEAIDVWSCILSIGWGTKAIVHYV